MTRVLVILVLVVGAVSLGSVWFWWTSVSGAMDKNDHRKISVVVPRGSSAADVGKILVESGLIRDPFVFRIAAQLKRSATKIVAGDYTLSRDKSLDEILTVLNKGPIDLWVTIPEGWRREQVAAKFDGTLQSKNRKFDVKEFLSRTGRLEGRLFPDTYLIPQEVSAESVVAIMTNNFEKRTKVFLVPPYSSGLTTQEVMTLASIIERETKGGEEERAIVAGILLKRLKNKWPLQADATLQYMRDSENLAGLRLPMADFKFWQPVGAQEKQVDSPYNTYLHRGLPPTPIANPGLSAIKAVLSPASSPYWFYLHGKDGNIHFAATIEEHQRNISQYL